MMLHLGIKTDPDQAEHGVYPVDSPPRRRDQFSGNPWFYFRTWLPLTVAALKKETRC
jgi:hypothetical protein